MLDLFGSMLDPWRGDEPPNASTSPAWLEGIFLFSMTWSLGGSLPNAARTKFNTFVRELVAGQDPEHPKPKEPKDLKFAKQSVPPERGGLHDFLFREGQVNAVWCHLHAHTLSYTCSDADVERGCATLVEALCRAALSICISRVDKLQLSEILFHF